MASIEVRFIGLGKVERDLSQEAFTARARRAMQMGGTVVEGAAKGIVADHHYTGRFERGIHTTTEGTSIGSLVTRVGVSAGAVPEARPLTYGWVSQSGRLPSIDALTAWVQKKIGGDQDPVGAAIRIAWSIFRRGFAFGKLDTFTRAYDDNKERVQIAIARGFSGHGF